MMSTICCCKRQLITCSFFIDRYDEGDDNMKRIIGEAMLKSKSGEKMDTPSLPSMDGL